TGEPVGRLGSWCHAAVSIEDTSGTVAELPTAQPSSGRTTLAGSGRPVMACVWQATYVAVGALVLTAHRVATFLGPREQATALYTWMGESRRRLPDVRAPARRESEAPNLESHS